MRRLAVFCGGFAAGIFAAQYLLAVDWLLPVEGGILWCVTELTDKKTLDHVIGLLQEVSGQ